MAVVLTGSEYIDLSAHGAALDVRGAPLVVYAEIETSTDDGGFRTIVGHGLTPGGSSEYELYLNDGEVTAYWEHSSGAEEAGPATVDDGNLHRVLMALSSAEDVIALVVDGAIIDAEDISGSTANHGNETRIGSHPGFDNFIGQISNVAIWNVDFTSGDAQALTAGTDNPGDYPSGMLGWWPLDYDARDISGNNRHGTPVGNPDFTEEPPGGAEVEGTVDLSLGALTLTATGRRTVHGTAAADLGALTLTATGRRTVHGAASASLGGLTLTATGTVTRHGTANVGLGALSLTATGTVVRHGAATVDLGGLELTVTGHRTAHGAATVTLGGLTLTALAKIEVEVNLDLVALSPVFRSRIAAAPEFRQRVALSPELGHGDAGAPVLAARTAGAPVLAHGQADAPELVPRAAGEPVFRHGDADDVTL